MTTENQAPEGAAPALREALEQIAQTLEGHPLYMGDGHTEDDFIREGGDAATVTELAYVARAALAAQPQAAREYQQANPLGGPAKVFRAMADAIEAGDSYEDTLRRYGYAEAVPSPAEAHGAADTVQLVGVKDGVETVIGTATMPPKMKARELVREMFGAWEPDDGSDADMAFAICEQLIEWMPKNPPTFNVESKAQPKGSQS